MSKQKPHNFEYHQYLRQVLLSWESDQPLYVATEKDFKRGPGISFPYRSYFYAMGLMHEDSCRLQVGVREFEIKKQSMTVVGPGIVRLWLENDWKVKNTTIFFKPELFKLPFNGNFLLHYPFFKAGAQHVLDLSNEEYEKANAMIRLLEKHKGNQSISSGLLFSLLELINNIYPASIDKNISLSRAYQIIRDFDRALNEHYQERKEVNFYADSLNITPKHLSDVLKKETGMTAKQSIEAFIFFEAKSLLKQTDMTIKEIAYWLGYDDPSYFNKLFKNKAGMTPLNYRKTI
ncbi:MAG: helix-turn-helix transcriptional regulator [Leptolyngbya sp. SIO1D8]|nr:helix-turn-helix transcriptional regulator [Leptolyngbya sp. SIO1D8]